MHGLTHVTEAPAATIAGTCRKQSREVGMLMLETTQIFTPRKLLIGSPSIGPRTSTVSGVVFIVLKVFGCYAIQHNTEKRGSRLADDFRSQAN